MNSKQLKFIVILGLIMLLVACASKRTKEIGDPTLTSPEEHQHYMTVNDAFSRHDTNGDGFLDRHEFDQLQRDPEIVRLRQSIAELAKSGPLLFEEIDENDDGKISLNELTIIIQPLIPAKR